MLGCSCLLHIVLRVEVLGDATLQYTCFVQDFESCLAELRGSSRTSWAVPKDAPLHGVGHSNGALMHLLLGAIAAVPYSSAIAISFNNKCACVRLAFSLGTSAALRSLSAAALCSQQQFRPVR